MIILFVNIKLSIDRCLSKGFPHQLHGALRKFIGMKLALRVYMYVHVRVAQSVEYVATMLFHLLASQVRVQLCTFIFFLFIY